MAVHYLEIVSAQVDDLCGTYTRLYGLTFAPKDEHLGQAAVARLPEGSRLGIRAPMSPEEKPVVRIYMRVNDISEAVRVAAEQGADIALPPTTLGADHGTIAIFIQGGIEHGVWQQRWPDVSPS